MQVHVNVETRYGDRDLEKSMESKAKSLKTLLSFMGDFDVKYDFKNVPTLYKTMLPVLDTSNFLELGTDNVHTNKSDIATLENVLRVNKPKIWVDITKSHRAYGHESCSQGVACK